MTALTISPPVNEGSIPSDATPAGHKLDHGHMSVDAQGWTAVVANLPVGQRGTGTHHWLAAGATTQPAAAENPAMHMPGTLLLADPSLALVADILNDLEKTRTANQNRLRALTTAADVEDVDGVCRGFGLDEGHPQVAAVAGIVAGLEQLEHQSVLQLQRLMRKHPLGPWVKRTTGVGEKQGARLLAAIGDPYFNTLHNRPRTVSELWAYSGLHVIPSGQPTRDTHALTAAGDQFSHVDQGTADTQRTVVGVAARRRKGQKANWSTTAKTRAYLIATSCLKQLKRECKEGHVEDCQCSPYRVDYDRRRAHTATTHPDWSDGHSHNDALRIASKAILRDLWIESRNLHQKAGA